MTVINNAELYTPQYLGRRNVLVCNGVISAISEEAFNLSDNIIYDEVDLQGKRLVPGFIDCHAHITGGGGEAGFATQVPAVPLSHFTSAGVTTVVGLLGTDDTTRSIANLVSRAYALREEGMSAYCWTGGYHYPLNTLLGSATKDITFLDPVIGIGEFAISDHRSSQPQLSEVARLASEAHVAGLMTGKAGVIHFHLGDGARKLELIERALEETEIPARVFHPTHVNRNRALFDSACELTKRGCTIDITAFPDEFNAQGYSAGAAVELAIARGVALDKITISSDGGGCLPEFDSCGNLHKMDVGRPEALALALAECTARGATLEQVLPMLTSNIASLLRLTHKGRIDIGCDADLIALDDQLKICDVMALGKWHRRGDKQLVKGTFEH